MSSSTEHEWGSVRPPFAGLRPERRRWVFLVLLVLTLVVGGLVGHYGAFLNNETAPMGIVSFELARTTEASEAIVESWSEVRPAAWANILLDFPWMWMYASTLALGCVMAGAAWGRRFPSWMPVFAVLAWGQLLAAALDFVETASLAWILYTSSGAQPWPFIAWATAIPKFLLVFLGIPATLSGLIPWLLAKRG